MKKDNHIILGCVADDFTGASDVASFLSDKGIKTVLYDGIPNTEPPSDAKAIIVALKTRTQESSSAVADTLDAFNWLKKAGANKFYLKYCSTFDSTKEGNIGPIADAVLEQLNLKYTVLSPSLPVNGRTVKKGNLYVHGTLLHESHMKEHPLTPMWDAEIKTLMEAQSKYPCLNIYDDQLEKEPAAIYKQINDFGTDKKHFYVIPDYYTNEHGKRIIELFGDNSLLTGGSGLITPIADIMQDQINNQSVLQEENAKTNKAIILAGSLSAITLEQIKHYQESGGVSLEIDPSKLLDGKQDVKAIWDFVTNYPNQAVLLYSSNDKKQQNKDKIEQYAELLENTFAELAKHAVNSGYSHIIVAGGETSGAVTKGLGFQSFEIGKTISPGVPYLIPLKNNHIRIVLKSGNFGEKDFFRKSIDVLNEIPTTDKELQKKFEEIIWVAKSLFNRNVVTGSSANISFIHNDIIYISGSGTNFGTLKEADFSIMSKNGEQLAGIKPSKEFMLHKIMYDNDEKMTCVIHTHSTYSTLYSCLPLEEETDVLPSYTPYLKIKVGKVGLVPYAPPGSDELFQLLKERVSKSDAFLMKNHGLIVGGKTIMDAFNNLEELEYTAKIAWYLRGKDVPTIPMPEN